MTLRALGNSGAVTVIWAVAGAICALLIPIVIEGPHDDDVELHMLLALAACVCFYALAWRLNGTMSVPGWKGTVGANGFVSAVALFITVRYKAISVAMVVAKILFGVVVFAFVEIAKPISDFGLSQFFMRLPLFAACLLDDPMSFLLRMLAGFGLVFGTFWQAFMRPSATPTPSPTRPRFPRVSTDDDDDDEEDEDDSATAQLTRARGQQQ